MKRERQNRILELIESREIATQEELVDILKSEGYIGFKADFDISSQRLYELYELWCEENADKPLSTRSFFLEMASLAGEYNLEPTNKIHVNGREVRGYVGIYSLLP